MDRLLERQGQSGLEVGAAAGSVTAPTAALAEEPAEEVAQVELSSHATGGTESSGSPEAAHRAPGPYLVILTALVLVTDHAVGGRDLLEPGLGDGVTRIGVRMQTAGELAVRLGDLLGGGLPGDAERGVVILLEPLALRCHGVPASGQPRTLTIAGRRTRPCQP